MKKNKSIVKILSLVLVLVMAFSLVPVSASAETYRGGSANTNGWSSWWNWGWGSWWNWVWNNPRPTPEPEIAYPELDLTETVDGLTVTVNAPEGALPEGTEMTVTPVSLDAVQAAVDQTDGVSGTVLAAVDITFRAKTGDVIQPAKDVTVTIQSDAIAGRSDLSVVHLDLDADELGNNDVDAEPVVHASIQASTVTFDAKDFSVYAVVGDGETATVPMLTVNFYDKNGSIINVQVIRLDMLDYYESKNIPFVFDPGVPSITSTQSFEGWRADNYAAGVANENLDVDKINTYIKDNQSDLLAAANAAQNKTVSLNYHAMVYNVRYVVYHDQAGAVLMTQAFHVDVNDNTVQPASVKVEHTYVGFMGGQNFAGWITEDKVEVAGDYPLYKTLNTAEAPIGDVYKNGATYSLGDTIHLYPYLNTGHWLVFDTYKDQDDDPTSTSYISPAFYEEGTNTVAPAVPTRTGYEFKGWYKEKTLTNRFIFGSPISEDTTIYAKWEPKETTYQVIFWQQNPTDSVDAADTAKTYSFYKSDVRTATTGQSVSINTSNSGTTADNRLGGNDTSSIGEMGFYFTYNGTNSDTAPAVVKADGSTTLNVYYDRKVITYNFYGDLTTGYSSFNGSYYSSYYPHYGRSGSYGNYSYFRIYTNASTYSDGDYYQPTWYTNAACTTRYTGSTVYHLTFDTETLSNNSADVQFGSIQGLYGSTMDYFDWSSASTTISGNDWPYSGQYLMWHDATTGRYQNKMFQYTTGEATTSTTIDYYLNQYQVSSNTRPYTALGQDTDGNFTIELDGSGLKSTETLYFAGDVYFGYELDRYNKTTDNYNDATLWDGGQVTCSYDEIGSSGHAYFYYKRNQWNFVFESNNSQVKTESVYWEKSLSDLAGYVPTNGPEGCYFDGWYADPGFDTEFDFNQEMPNHAVQIYAKWTKMRFRVVLDPTGGESGVEPSNITFVGNQATTFRVDYGELIQASSINNAQREGYTLLGWYLDAAHTIPFNFNSPITDEIADMTYAEASDEERSGSDPWNKDANGNPVDYSDVGKKEVRGKVTVYASWRRDPDGVIGINVRYLADDKNGNTGLFASNRKNIWEDPNIYADQAEAFGQPASNPDNTNLQFLYWEILNKTGDVVGKVYPGQLWTVDYNNAVEEAINANSTEALFTFADYLRGENALTNSRVNPTPVKAETMTVYAPVDTIETGEDYLIGVKASNGTTYLLMNYNPSTGTYYGSASLSGYTTDHLSYAIPAVLDENGNVTGVDSSNISGATLAHVEWSFNSTSNGKYSIQSGYNSNYYLRVGDDESTTNLNLYPASYSSGYGATWVWDSSMHRLSHYYSSSYNRLYLAMLTVGGVPTYFDVDYDEDYARTVQLFKKTTIEVGPTMHTVTFMDGYTNTKIADVQVEDGTAAVAPDAPDHSDQGMIFNGWNTAFDNVTENITVTAQYVSQSTLSYTVTFRYMNSNGEWVSESQTVHHGQNATAPDLPTPPKGYTFNSWDKKYTNITSNLTINAVYKQVATTKYVVTLRALYGRASKTAATHIDWHANNGTGAVQSDINVGINKAVSIPTPDSFFNGDYSHAQGATAPTMGKLEYADHVFLGWARLATDDERDPSQLTVDDLYLKWNPSTGKYVTVAVEGDPYQVEDGKTATRVAADEIRPYHDMYAVWAKVFYVYHSGTNKVEQIVMTDYKKDGETRTQNLLELANMTEEGFLYGGYYTDYAGKTEGFNAKTKFTWDPNISAMNQDTKWAQFFTDTGATKYDGANVVWNAATDAIKDVDGLHVNPVAGATYYIKEVPADKYLRPYLHYTYRLGTGEICTAWLISDVDDVNYQQTGFVIVNANNEAEKIVSSLTVENATGGTTMKLTPKRLFGANNKGYLSYLTVINNGRAGEAITPLLNNGDTVKQYWVTPDGLIVTGTVSREYTNLDNQTALSKTEHTDAYSIAVFAAADNGADNGN